MLRLLTFGGLALERLDGQPAPRVRPQRLAIVAVLAAAGDRGVSRERLAELFWPGVDSERSRHSLRQALYALRQELGVDAVHAGAFLSLKRTELTCDIVEFRTAIARGDRAAAAALAVGPFLDGFYLTGAPELERWIDEERATLTADITRVMQALIKDAETAGDHDGVVEWWRRLTILDPLSGRHALGFLKALAARGDRAGALAFARAHEHVIRRELESDPDPGIRRLEAELRAMPSPAVIHPAPSHTPDADAAPQPTVDGAFASGDATHDAPATSRRPPWRNVALVGVTAIVVASLFVSGKLGLPGRGAAPTTPTFAVDLIRDDGVADSLKIGGVLTDMLATNLARVGGLSVLANARLMELTNPGQDTLATAYLAAARRGGATEIFRGRLVASSQSGLSMEIQRVDLATGIVRRGYRVVGTSPYALIDSMTAAIASDLQFQSPGGSVAKATTNSPTAYRLYEEGLRAYYLFDAPAAGRLMDAALHDDSTFAMAAYYAALLAVDANRDQVAAHDRALRLAAHAPDRERLTISADILGLNMEPTALAAAESLTTRYPSDPHAFALHSTALQLSGAWPEAVTMIERAIALDSASEPSGQKCRLCDEIVQLANIYLWWDSLPAAERTAQRLLKLRPRSHGVWLIKLRTAAARGDLAELRDDLRRFNETNPIATTTNFNLRFRVLAEDYDEVERLAPIAMEASRPEDAQEATWYRTIALRNQGRLAEALVLARTRARPSPDELAIALISLERGDPRTAVSIFGAQARADQSMWPPGIRARHSTWDKTLFGMAVAAAGDTVTLRALADTVESFGRESLYGRDRRAHHYLRGMLLLAQKRDGEALDQLRQAIHSPTHGFTRVNYELGRTLIRLNRPTEAVPVLRAALLGDIDGSNLYVTRTDLHELLAQAFDRLSMRDSAAVHYRAMIKAWQHADPLYHARREQAAKNLARLLRPAAPPP
jgi:DNA-binding SARP family transcriptional activator/tetratricopeptide (TPR) repeat protein